MSCLFEHRAIRVKSRVVYRGGLNLQDTEESMNYHDNKNESLQSSLNGG